MYGYTGKILQIDLTARETSVIDTEKYTEWGGGHGIGSALFWDLCEDKTVDGLDPKNVVTLMTSPMTGTMVPSASGRVELQGIGVQQYPIGWYTRSNFGGRFGGQLKYAGWDGIVVLGKADAPVWVDIVNDKVEIRDADGLWGQDTQQTQKSIWELKDTEDNEWMATGTSRDTGRTTQKPAILTMGPAGENLSAFACLVHDAGNGAGQGGFGAVFGSKNLKAISVVGTGEITVADPNALIAARINSKENYAQNPDEPGLPYGSAGFGIYPLALNGWAGVTAGQMGPQSCQGCINGCRQRTYNGVGNESHCQESVLYATYDALANGGTTVVSQIASDLVQTYGINSYEMQGCLHYLYALNQKGILGPGLEIDTTLDFSTIGSVDFLEKLIGFISNREDIGEALAGGTVRASVAWGRYEEDSADGTLEFPYWGMPEHAYDSRCEVQWGYGSILGDRDINEHGFTWLMWDVAIAQGYGYESPLTAEEWATIVTAKMEPYQDDINMMNYATDNIYSDSMAKTVAWHRHYTRFWKQSALYCDWRYPDFCNYHREDKVGGTGVVEGEFWKAVTGEDVSFAEGVELGRKIWNLDNAIWTLQGRHRDMVRYAPYVYTEDAEVTHVGTFYPMPGLVDGKWEIINTTGRHIDSDGFEELKTKFYTLEGWDVESGWPTRATLEELGLDDVASALESAGKLGA